MAEFTRRTFSVNRRQPQRSCPAHFSSLAFGRMEDRYGHRISYLRVSITDRCNERCTYCMPRELQEWLPRADVLSYEETLRLIRISAELGVSKVRITGGEPLTRRDVLGFFQQLPSIPGIIQSVTITESD
jgi:cyclic pyranopterin phosphate synthase